MFAFERPVRFEEVDAAGIVFFARFFGYCHDAMEALFDGVPGGYRGLVLGRKIGFPAVHTEADFRGPLRYGDVAAIAVGVERLGTSSLALRHELTRKVDGAAVASILVVVASSDLTRLKAVPIPDDVRALLVQHRIVPSAGA